MFKLNRKYQAPLIEKNEENNELLKSDKFFITYANPAYFEILYNLIKGLEFYSEIPVIIYVVNIPNKKILLPNKFKEFNNIIIRYVSSKDHIWATKFTIMIDSINYIKNINANFVYLDADTLVNYSIDQVFNFSHKVINVPYLSVHPDYIQAVKSLYDVIGKGKKIEFNKEFGHSNVIWYNSNCSDIFKEGYSLIIRHKGLGDEPVINYLQNKYNLLENIPYMTPNFKIYKKYINKEDIKQVIGKKKGGEYFEEIYLHLFHGCKDPKICNEINNQLEEFNLENENYQIHYKINN